MITVLPRGWLMAFVSSVWTGPPNRGRETLTARPARPTSTRNLRSRRYGPPSGRRRTTRFSHTWLVLHWMQMDNEAALR